jgi:cephalosporin hydroxylase
MSAYEQFKRERNTEIATQGADERLARASLDWLTQANRHRYSYNFEWLGRPIIQYPQDIVAMQELIWSVQPDMIIETGIAHGGSLVFLASMLELNAICGGPQDARVVGVDIDIRAHNRAALEAHPLYRRITMIEGSSVDEEVVREVHRLAAGRERILISLDSNHSHDHVLAELRAYAPLTTEGSYCVVFDTVIENLPDDMFGDRPWSVGDNPMTAVDAFVAEHPEFEIDETVDQKLLISVAPRGYLRRRAGER